MSISHQARSAHAAAAPEGVRKFQFDDFDAAAVTSEIFQETPVDPTFTLEETNAARIAAEAEGHARGVEETQATIDAETARLLMRVTQDMAALLAEQKSQRDFIAAEAVRLSVEIARKVLPAAAEAGALREVETLILRCLNERPEESRMVIRLHDALLDPVKQKMDKLIEETGFGAKPVLLADPSLKRAELRIEWANGGVDWNFDLALTDMETAARRLAARPPARAQARTDREDITGADEAIQESEL